MPNNNFKVHVKGHVKEKKKVSLNSRLKILDTLFSDPKIYKYHEIKNGKKVVSTKKPWHVYYYFRNPSTGLMEKFMKKSGINKETSISRRNAAAKNLQRAIKRYLQEGYSPFEEIQFNNDVVSENYTTIEAIKIAFEHKKNSWKESSKDVNTVYYNSFVKWLKEKKIDKKPINYLTKKHISFYLGDLSKRLSNVSRNNHKRVLSGLFSELVEKDIIKQNFILKINDLKSNAKKNKPFNHKQLDDILKYIKENDPYLYDFIKVMWYSFLRPIEIIRLKVKNVDLINNTIEVESKTEDRTYIRLVKPLQKYFKELEMQNYTSDMLIYTRDNKIGYWETKKEKSREDWFGRKFKKVKNHFNLGDEYGIYSFRHTSALSVYYNFRNEGFSEFESVLKLQEIMRHKDQQVTRKYLREIGGQLPEDWSKDYNYEVL
ncbi:MULTISPECIES: tyrosine-type recombinase/integrase [unclassified Tenacibaculum]|uniref:tyrosine-type recombinase/integrase n=1 Tax=unclassified Tenacibaculum TaxID=2635139 RepID=UPI001F39E3B7|nr:MULTISPECIES: tyrosine-type recombinase/integrase [unclassified Tenacibaculum]MCF2875451.1 tyrosine-type recombinase/integrase [Tenacibaculum sp. Cn5-1]MCF2935527.1 tyrosine-type recombinase/integrase [Tenacibaculum sp. Cn5-34]MCG7512087.1 tyrosine-type recombinase/integrase [Tenacibaculum sp. Cn5-46]